MAIEFHEDHELYLPLTEGERDALKDILQHVSRAHRQGKTRMSAAEETDVKSLTEKVEAL